MADVLDGQESLRELFKSIDWEVMHFSSCRNCGKDIYSGPFRTSNIDGPTPNDVVWRHVHTEYIHCAPSVAQPVEE